ncbi:MAG: Gfo/Idh/MocA family protein [Planctomycetota bacterium]
MLERAVSRRRFLRTATAAAAAPLIVPARALGGEGKTPPSEQIGLGVIGYGNRCRRVLGHFMLFDEVRPLAVSDCKAKQRQACKARVDKHHGNKDCQTFPDFREMLARPEIDACLIATGDRWHSMASIYAARAGKDMYCEKPISLTIEEGRAMAETMKRFGTVYQAGHQRRSVDSYRFQNEMVRSQRIGKLHTIICRVWAGPVLKPHPSRPVPKGFDYDTWLGPTPWHPYNPVRVRGWNWFWDTGSGVTANMGCHYTDLAQWGHASDDTGPVTFDGRGRFDPNAFSDTPVTAETTCTYADGVKILIQSQGAFADRFIRFVGTEGWVQVDDHTNVVTAEPASLLRHRSIAARSWAHTGGHIRNFLDCVRSREPTVCTPESAHRATTICHAANLSIRLGRTLHWDPQAERFRDDPEANQMISRATRAPWTL